MTKIFLYSSPFVLTETASVKNTYLSDTISFSESEREDTKRLYGLLFKFAVDNGIIDVKDGAPLVSTGNDTGSWIWAVNWMNFRSLVDTSQYAKLMASLEANSGYPVTTLINLHTRLGILFDPIFLNTLANRTLQSIQIIPYDTSSSQNVTSWESIHVETPFVWLLILIQTVLKSEIVTIGYKNT